MFNTDHSAARKQRLGRRNKLDRWLLRPRRQPAAVLPVAISETTRIRFRFSSRQKGPVVGRYGDWC